MYIVFHNQSVVQKKKKEKKRNFNLTKSRVHSNLDSPDYFYINNIKPRMHHSH